MDHLIVQFTDAEKRMIEERWIEARISELHSFHEKYARLEQQLQRLARHVGLELQDAK
jgi:hypothetical protein